MFKQVIAAVNGICCGGGLELALSADIIVKESEALSFQAALNKCNRLEFDTTGTLYASEDFREGTKAFAEKRAPIWKGRWSAPPRHDHKVGEVYHERCGE